MKICASITGESEVIWNTLVKKYDIGVSKIIQQLLKQSDGVLIFNKVHTRIEADDQLAEGAGVVREVLKDDVEEGVLPKSHRKPRTVKHGTPEWEVLEGLEEEVLGNDMPVKRDADGVCWFDANGSGYVEIIS